MFRKKKILTVVIIAFFALAVMTYVEKVLQPGYWIKSLIKILVLAGPLFLYSLHDQVDFLQLIGLKKKRPSGKLLFCIVFAYAGIIVLYLLLKDQIDLNGIRGRLLAKEGLNRNNFLFIFSYIILINSFLEESFFRGFLYQVFRSEGYEKAGVLFSALVFALYHISIMDGWFHPAIMALGIIGLFLTGVFLQLICRYEDSLLGSWLVHGAANLAINTIAVIMLFS
ncbi:MAG: CPBP family intramembrane metalloprotease [Erysipelotrichaceae bacterium]|nr:CPBP family intramembrane metalloprotease [Erysipelotrichaceae bacterium]